MKLQIVKMLAVAALFGGLTACNNELTEPQADQVPENAVRITASINNPFATTRSMPLGTVEDQAKFKEGDEILMTTANSVPPIVSMALPGSPKTASTSFGNTTGRSLSEPIIPSNMA